jgi:ankyrin repeat protein
MPFATHNAEIYIENNLFLVKRLIERIDIRNPDPGPKRYTSLAWAVAEGNEDMFEYLLNAGHDDEELSRVQATKVSLPDGSHINFLTGFGK